MAITIHDSIPLRRRRTSFQIIAKMPAQQGRGRVGSFGRGAASTFQGFMSRSPILVVETLRNENSVRETEVYRDGDYDGDETGPNAANEIRYVANEPDKDEEE